MGTHTDVAMGLQWAVILKLGKGQHKMRSMITMINSQKEGMKRGFFSTLNSRITFQIALLLAPLSYCIHQLEESSGGFRPWRLQYFPDNNRLPVEYVFVILTAITLVFIIYNAVRKNKVSAQVVILLLMATQVQNALYHAGAGLFFMDYSPGTITAILLYVPVNIFIWLKAIEEGWITKATVLVLFILGGIAFWSFELLGPMLIAVFLGLTVLYVIGSELKIKLQK